MVFSYVWSLITHESRNSRANQIMDQLRRGERPNYALFLRGFRDENLSTRSMERRLARYLGERTLLIGLSGGFPQPGLARIRSTEDRWYQDFLLLATGAIVIFINSPSYMPVKESFDHPSLMTELRALYERNLLGRTVIVGIDGGGRIMTPDGQKRTLGQTSIREIVSYYSRYTSADLPPPSKGYLASVQIKFEQHLGNRHSAPVSPSESGRPRGIYDPETGQLRAIFDPASGNTYFTNE